MLTSMTGFGRSEVSQNGLAVSVEIKSVNNRYCDISVHLPNNIKSLEADVRKLILQGVKRGKINVSINIERENEVDIGIETNRKVLNSYLHLLKDVKTISGVDQEITLEHLLGFKDIFTPKEADEKEQETILEVITSATLKALDELQNIRNKEGLHLATDLTERVDEIEKRLIEVKKRAVERVPEARIKFQERIKALLDDDSYDKDRLETEIAIMSDKLDITEEIVRLESHLKLFREAVNGDDAVGRRLNFLSQEMNREINTMGSKANDSTIAHQVVYMKEVLENIREQIMNVE